MKKQLVFLANILFLLLIPVFSGYAAAVKEAPRDKITIELQATENEDGKETVTLSGPTVRFSKGGRTLLRINGLSGNTGGINEPVTELVTHFHGDHINISEVEQAIREGSFIRLIGPNPALDVSRNRVFSIIREQTGIREYNIRQQNRILEITLEGNPLTNTYTGAIGDFDYSRVRVADDITVQMFKYRYPRGANSDGLIYRVTHKDMSYLLFGDFDDIDGIENLVNASEVNEALYYQTEGNRTKLVDQRWEANDKLRQLSILRTYLEITAGTPDDDPNVLALKQQIPEGLEKVNAQIVEQETVIKELTTEIDKLDKELDRLPFIKADVIKWPHYVRVFENNERADNIIRKLDEVVKPRFIIWQTHPSRIDDNFDDYIKRFDFYDKFQCSDQNDFEFISLLDLLNAKGVA